MTAYHVYIDDHEVSVWPVGADDIVEIPDHLEDAFVEYIETDQPTRAEIDEWIEQRTREDDEPRGGSWASDGRDSDPGYRSSMIDAGRGGLLR